MLNQNFLEYNYDYLFNLNEKNNFELYLKFKNKYNYSLNEKELIELNNEIKKELLNNNKFKSSDLIMIPETDNENFLNLLKQTNKQIFILSKSKKEDILFFLENEKMMKMEKSKLLNILNKKDKIKIADIPGNQRKRFINCLFNKEILKKININNKILFLDDSIFSGYTFLAAQEMLKSYKVENVILFNKKV